VKKNIFTGKFIDQTFNVSERVKRSHHPENPLTPSWGGAPPG